MSFANFEFKAPTFDETLFVVDEHGVTLHWDEPGADPYGSIPWSRFPDQSAVLHFVMHVTGKQWPRMTPDRIHRLVEAIGQHQGFSVWGVSSRQPGTWVS